VAEKDSSTLLFCERMTMRVVRVETCWGWTVTTTDAYLLVGFFIYFLFLYNVFIVKVQELACIMR